MRTHLCLTKSEVLKYKCRSNLLCATTLCLGILSQTSLDPQNKTLIIRCRTNFNNQTKMCFVDP